MADKIKVLLIEDDTFLLSMYSSKFEMDDFTVLAAEDGEKGIKMTQEEKPDIILLDVMLPKMNGFQVLEAIKSDENIKHIPVILLTNLSQKEDIERAMTMGAADYLVKAHYMPSEVVDKIKAVLENNSYKLSGN